MGLAQGPDLGGQLRLVSLSALQGGDAPLRRREGGLVSLLLHRVGQAVHCRSVGLLARLLRQGVERPVDLGVVGVEVHPLHLVRGLPLGEPIILRLSACHKKSLLS